MPFRRFAKAKFERNEDMDLLKGLGMETELKSESKTEFKLNMEDFVAAAGNMNLPRIPPPPPIEDKYPDANLVLHWIELTDHNRHIAARHIPYEPANDPFVQMCLQATGQTVKAPDMIAPYVFWVQKYPEGIRSIAEFNWFMEVADYKMVPPLRSVPRGRKMFANYNMENALPMAEVFNEIMTVEHVGSIPPNVAEFARFATPGPHQIPHEYWHAFREFLGMPTS